MITIHLSETKIIGMPKRQMVITFAILASLGYVIGFVAAPLILGMC